MKNDHWAKHSAKCLTCGKTFDTRSPGAGKRYCSTECSPWLGKDGPGNFTIFERDGFRCIYCGASSVEGAQLAVDHIIPVAKGGTDRADNLVTACRSCNSAKSARLLDTDVARRIVNEVRKRNGGIHLPNDQIVFTATSAEKRRLMRKPSWQR